MVLPDIERCALTILAQQNPKHPILRLWVEKIVEDADYVDSIGYLPISAEMAEEMMSMDPEYDNENGYPDPRTLRYGLFAALLDGYAHPKRKDWKAYGTFGDQGAYYVRRMDEFITRLAYAVVKFRRDGRPTGDVTGEIMGMGEPLAYVTSPLAANVAQFSINVQSHLFYVVAKLNGDA